MSDINDSFHKGLPILKDLENVILPTGIAKGTVAATVLVYPNPAQNELFIQSNSPVEQVDIYTLSDMNVRDVYNITGKIDISKLPEGIYLLRVYINSTPQTTKIIIRR
jgi:ERCC4-related helicase